MSREKQIEEMAEITKVHCELENQCGSCHWETCNDCFAEILYNAGYRKQSENTVEVVRCKDCKRKQIDAFDRTVCVRNGQMITIQDEGYCYYGERK